MRCEPSFHYEMPPSMEPSTGPWQTSKSINSSRCSILFETTFPKAIPQKHNAFAIADGEVWTMPATIDDPAVLVEIGFELKSHRVGAG